MESNKEFLGTEPIGKLLFRLSIPTVVAQLINMLYNIVDRIYIGHMPGDGSLALTGVGVCMPLILLVAAFAALVSSGGAPRASIFMGKRDHDAAEKTLGNCFSLQVVVSMILTAVLLIWNEELLLAFGASENTIGYATDYMSVYAIGTLFVQMTLGMNTFITAQGFTKISMIAVMIGAVCNIAFDPLFIFGLNMGVKGAALATILSQAISCVWVISFLCGQKTRLRIRKKNIRLQGKIIWPCIALGAAAFIMQASESVISICFNASLLEYGGDIAVGAMTIMVSVMQFAMLPLQGIAQGAQPITSYNYGAKNPGRVKKTFRLLLMTCLTYSVTLWAAVMLFPKVFVGIFTPDKALIDFTAPMLQIYLGGVCLFGIQIACQMTFTSLGKAVNSIIVAVVRKFVLLLPLIYIMPHVVADQTKGVYMAEPVADVIAVTFTAILFTFQFKKAMKEIELQGSRKLEAV
ncbi:MAG: MATE family efflux transporter [Clostridia bacterium]|nr:MATE family efflux transporter [Clostridia bacterium]